MRFVFTKKSSEGDMPELCKKPCVIAGTRYSQIDVEKFERMHWKACIPDGFSAIVNLVAEVL